MKGLSRGDVEDEGGRVDKSVRRTDRAVRSSEGHRKAVQL